MVLGVKVIAANPVKAQAVKGKKRTPIFKQLKSAGFTPSRITITGPSGTVTKIEFGKVAEDPARIHGIGYWTND